MDIEIIKEFVTLADRLNFSQTAKEHYITQPVLTKHIKQLEEDLGAALFFRDHQKVELTAEGKEFLPNAVAISSAYDEAKEKIRTSKEKYSSSLNIAFLDAAIREKLPRWISEFSALYPNVNVDCTSTSIPMASELLRNHACDLAITLQMPRFSYPDFNFLLLYRDPICVFVSENHRFADRPSVSLSELSSERCIIASEDFVKDYREFIEQALKKYKVKMISTRLSESVEQAFMLVDAGAGITLAPAHQRHFSTSNVKMISLEEKDIYVDVVLTWLKNNDNPNIQHFVRMVRESLKNDQK